MIPRCTSIICLQFAPIRRPRWPERRIMFSDWLKFQLPARSKPLGPLNWNSLDIVYRWSSINSPHLVTIPHPIWLSLVGDWYRFSLASGLVSFLYLSSPNSVSFNFLEVVYLQIDFSTCLFFDLDFATRSLDWQ